MLLLFKVPVSGSTKPPWPPGLIPPSQLCRASPPPRAPCLFPTRLVPAALGAAEPQELLRVPGSRVWHLSAERVISSWRPRRKLLGLLASLTPHRCSACLSHYLTFLAGLASSRPVTTPSSPDLHISPPAPVRSYTVRSSCCPQPAGN